MEVYLKSMRYLIGNIWNNLTSSVSSNRIDGVELKTESSKPYKLHYKTYSRGNGWLPYVTSLENDYAGLPNSAIEAVQISVSDTNGIYLDSNYVVMYRVYMNESWLPWVSNANAIIMHSIKSKYRLPGTLDTVSPDAGLAGSGSNITRIEIRIFEGEVEASNGGNTPPPSKGQIKVFIDPGHGGSDPGAIGNGLNEKDINLSIAKKIGNLLNSKGISIEYSRASDVYVSLDDRAKQANNWGGSLFISIHTNASDSSVSGTESYTYPSADTNNKILSGNISKAIATTFKIPNRGHKEADFAVLRLTNMNAILVETSFISNAIDSSLLKNRQDDFATIITNEILRYFNFINIG
ncbi:MAG: N-acetylmuramoyl-L-alanine amidase [Clostridiaceae bacterium]